MIMASITHKDQTERVSWLLCNTRSSLEEGWRELFDLPPSSSGTIRLYDTTTSVIVIGIPGPGSYRLEVIERKLVR